MLPCLTLGGGGVSIVEVQPGKEASLLVVTVDGTLYLWSFQHGCAVRKVLRTSVAMAVLATMRVAVKTTRALSRQVVAGAREGRARGRKGKAREREGRLEGLQATKPMASTQAMQMPWPTTGKRMSSGAC